MSGGWQFFVDRGGTFTDVVALAPDSSVHVRKLLSDNPDHYKDATVAAVQQLAGQDPVSMVKVGTTIATNALLERKGERTLFVTTKGFADALRIGYQNRPNIFARHIVLPDVLYERVIEVDERISASGKILVELDTNSAKLHLQKAFDDGFRSCAIVLMHGYRYPNNERTLAKLAQEIGFTNISISSDVSPLVKLVSRGDTTVADAYLSPVLRRYVDELTNDLPDCKLVFMQSNGGLVESKSFRGKDSLLSGPAGGIVGAVKTSIQAGFDKIIAFDMGGTSTDVSHYDGSFERTQETEIAGTRIRVPMLSIHTVAAGGGSVLTFDGQRYRVGPHSAGANPGPACYRKGGPLTVTDANVALGKIQPNYFPHIFGSQANLPIDTAVVQSKFAELGKDIAEVAEGFLSIAIQKMSNAIKKITIERGHDVSEYALCCFGGAGGQHACLIAESLGIKTIFIHTYAGVLSAYGIGQADLSVIREQTVDFLLTENNVKTVANLLKELGTQAKLDLQSQNIPIERLEEKHTVRMKYSGSDSSIELDFTEMGTLADIFTKKHQQLFGFVYKKKELVLESIAAEIIGVMSPAQANFGTSSATTQPIDNTQFYSKGKWNQAPIYRRQFLQANQVISGPAIILDETGTNIIEPGWEATTTKEGHIILKALEGTTSLDTRRQCASMTADPIKLELFNNLFMSIAENMGVTLQSTSHSVNIKERLDFSCAIFDKDGNLIANAPHIPVHLGSMGDSIRSVISTNKDSIKAGNIYALNNPYNGGTHLPDITVVTPVFPKKASEPVFYVASRAHHADIGGVTPGSMPPASKTIDEEGILIDNFLLVKEGNFHEKEFRNLLTSGPYPARNPSQNIADIQAQIAANEKGVKDLEELVGHYGLETVTSYMQFVQSNAEESVRRAISNLTDGSFTSLLDDGSQITTKVTIDKTSRSATIDFTDTSAQQLSNFNAPSAITKAAVLYVFRTLVDDDIPLNEGCLKPLTLIIPDGSLLNPKYPAAIVAGNVETSQAIVDTLYAAMGVLAASQGTMNNFTFGNENYQYYETICGGSGAGPFFNGTDAVHTHMTNSRLTDPEVLENRFPITVQSFSIRKDSAGKGKFHGGNGVIRRIGFNEEMSVSILSNRRKIAPFGILGGKAALPGNNYIERATGTKEILAGTATTTVKPGDIITIETPGGGGFG